jgi:hypothetical protein
MERIKEHLVYVKGKKINISENSTHIWESDNHQKQGDHGSSKFEVNFGKSKSKRIEYLGVNFHWKEQ